MRTRCPPGKGELSDGAGCSQHGPLIGHREAREWLVMGASATDAAPSSHDIPVEGERAECACNVPGKRGEVPPAHVPMMGNGEEAPQLHPGWLRVGGGIRGWWGCTKTRTCLVCGLPGPQAHVWATRTPAPATERDFEHHGAGGVRQFTIPSLPAAFPAGTQCPIGCRCSPRKGAQNVSALVSVCDDGRESSSLLCGGRGLNEHPLRICALWGVFPRPGRATGRSVWPGQPQ